MKKTILSLTALVATTFLTTNNLHAQRGVPYINGAGLLIDFGDGSTLVGPHIKHFFTSHDAGQAEVLFGDHVTFLGLEYSYNAPIKGTRGLFWNAGVGGQVALYDGGSDFYIRPLVGLEYKIRTAPIALGFDWRPMWRLTHDNGFTGARFGITGKFTF